jgi:hypothetical protein
MTPFCRLGRPWFSFMAKCLIVPVMSRRANSEMVSRAVHIIPIDVLTPIFFSIKKTYFDRATQ